MHLLSFSLAGHVLQHAYINRHYERYNMHKQPASQHLHCCNLNTPARGGVTCDDGSALQADPRTLVVPLSPPSPVAPCRAHVWWPPCHASPRSPHSGTTLPTWSAPAAVTGFRTVLLSSPAAGPHAAVHPASRSGSCSWRSPASVDCSHAWS